MQHSLHPFPDSESLVERRHTYMCRPTRSNKRCCRIHTTISYNVHTHSHLLCLVRPPIDQYTNQTQAVHTETTKIIMRHAVMHSLSKNAHPTASADDTIAMAMQNIDRFLGSLRWRFFAGTSCDADIRSEYMAKTTFRTVSLCLFIL